MCSVPRYPRRERRIMDCARNRLHLAKKEIPMSGEMMREFSNPGSIYRGAPFWAWNNRLNADQLRRQIDCFKEMGLGGFHMHPRTGMDTEYLSDEFMSMIRACRDHAEKTGMLAWLYDEGRRRNCDQRRALSRAAPALHSATLWCQTRRCKGVWRLTCRRHALRERRTPCRL